MIRGIVKILSDAVGVTALVDADNIFPVVAKQDTQRPYVTIRRIGETAQGMKNQVSNTDRIVFNITAYSEKYKDAIDILYAIRTALDGYTGTIQSVKFHTIYYDNSQDLYDKDDLSFVIVDTYAARWSRL